MKARRRAVIGLMLAPLATLKAQIQESGNDLKVIPSLDNFSSLSIQLSADPSHTALTVISGSAVITMTVKEVLEALRG